MRNFIFLALAFSVLAACEKKETHSRTADEQTAYEQKFEPGKPTDRSKSKSY